MKDTKDLEKNVKRTEHGVQYYHSEFCILSQSSDVNDCVGSTCANGGTCADQAEGYACLCTELWEGPNCTGTYIYY